MFYQWQCGALRFSGAAVFLSAAAMLAQSPDPLTNTNSLERQPYRLEAITVLGGAPDSVASATSASVDDIALRGVSSALDFSALSPNLAVFQGVGERSPRLSVRGLRENNLTVGEPQATLYVDDVPYDEVFTRGTPLFDLETVELFRGPQGTAFGAGRPGGLLNVHTRLPDGQGRGLASFRYGNYDAIRAETVLGGPIVSNALYASVGGLFFKRDGFVHNTTTGRDSDTRETLAGRAQVRWTPSELFDFTFTASGYRFDDGMEPGTPLGQQDYFTVSRNFDGFHRQSAHTEAFRAAYTAEAFKIVSITVHSDWRETLRQDSDYQPVDVAATDLRRELGEWSQELRAQSLDDDARWRWLAGGFFSDKRLLTDVTTSYNFPPIRLNDRSTQHDDDQNFALFGQTTVELLGNLELTAGLRFESDPRHSTATRQNELVGGPGTPLITTSQSAQTFMSLQPKFEAAWQFDSGDRVWFSVARGFQPGDFNLTSSGVPLTFDAADSWHYELGGRGRWFDGKLTATAAAFYTDVRDYQIFRPTGIGSFVMLNAERAHTVGAELELNLRPSERWELWFGGGYVSAVFDHFTDPSNGANLDGKTINFVPQYTLNLGVTWRPIAGWFMQLGAEGIGSFWFDENNTTRQKAYWLVNARAGYEGRHFGCAMFARNAQGTRYIANAIHITGPGGAFFVASPGEPAIFGVEVFARF